MSKQIFAAANENFSRLRRWISYLPLTLFLFLAAFLGGLLAAFRRRFFGCHGFIG
ncbi:MAG: hypothetical protein WC374_10535 [Phycisphaerae bacterium]